MRGKRLIWMTAIGVAALVMAWIGWSMRDTFAYAQMATGFAAKQTCSCRHISGRSMDSCVQDFPEDARRQVNVSEAGDRVRASVLLGAIHAEARYDGEYGCVLVN